MTDESTASTQSSGELSQENDSSLHASEKRAVAPEASSNVPELIAPAFNNPNNDSTQPTYKTQAEWEADRRKLADVAHDSLNGFLRASIYQRADLLRDTLAVAVTLLVGALTLYFTSADKIRTPFLFFVSLLVLMVGIIANLIARIEIVKHLNDVSFQIEKNYITIYGASRQVLGLPSATNIDSAWRVERETPPFPVLRRRGEYGHTISIWTTVSAILGIALSFIFHIS